jgi:carbamoyl-phosphate synthase large subunit
VEFVDVDRNILLTSAGRRGLLVRLFQRELRQLFPGAQVYAADLSPEISSACQLADRSFKVRSLSDPGYIDQLLDLCDNHAISLIVPTIDTELLLLAENSERFIRRGVQVAVSHPDLVRQCRDKRLTAELFARHGIASPREIKPTADAQYPLFAKPYDGSSSRDLHVLQSFADVTPQITDSSKLVCYEYMSPGDYDEYTVDMYFDRHSDLKCLVPRLRIETRAGEVSKGRTERISALGELRVKLQTVQGAHGCITSQFFVRRSDGQVFGIEVNPRFGGGYPLSYEAGANFPKWLIGEYLGGETISFFKDWEDGLTMLRYDDHVLVRTAS